MDVEYLLACNGSSLQHTLCNQSNFQRPLFNSSKIIDLARKRSLGISKLRKGEPPPQPPPNPSPRRAAAFAKMHDKYKINTTARYTLVGLSSAALVDDWFYPGKANRMYMKR